MPLLLASCYPLRSPVPDGETHPDFIPYITKYLQFKGATKLSRQIPIQFGQLPCQLRKCQVGVCSRWSNGERLIRIDERHWDNYSENERFQVLAHELGHCELDRDHVDDKSDLGYPMSIMYSYTFEPHDNQIEYYMKELFTPGKAVPLLSDMGCVEDKQ